MLVTDWLEFCGGTRRYNRGPRPVAIVRLPPEMPSSRNGGRDGREIYFLAGDEWPRR